MLGSIRFQSSFAQLSVTIVLLIALLLTMAFAFAKVSVPTHATPHAQSSHVQELACGGELAPECG